MSPDDRKCVFQYDRAWLSDGFSLSPLELPLKPELFIADKESFSGNFGIFDDSIPDGYGRYLLSRLLRKQGVDASILTPVQLLSIVGDSGMGALAYFPESFAGEEKSYSSHRLSDSGFRPSGADVQENGVQCGRGEQGRPSEKFQFHMRGCKVAARAGV